MKKRYSNTTEQNILIPPDISICKDCLRELNDPSNRRYNYPFISCGNCGPCFTTIRDIPFRRDATTMQEFDMCPNCLNEYHNPRDRRYHNEINACPDCGPQAFLYVRNQKINTLNPIQEAQKRLKRGEVGAIKGLGGFHLACDAQNGQAVLKIKEIKKRDQKPFALMAENILTIKNFCFVPELAKKYLESREKPIVLLKKKKNISLSPNIAPGNAFLGFMLPYTPLHYLLLQRSRMVLVMTSANFSDEPIIIENDAAFQELGQVVDFLLIHNRKIYNRCDDSVVKITGNQSIFIRRSRGYAPFPIKLSKETKYVLALGPEEKNTICLAGDVYAFPSQHLGDLKNRDSYLAYQEAARRLLRMFQFKPKVIACDLHPDYLSTHYAEELSQQLTIPLIRVQHHHAHIVSCMAENNISENVIGVALDGTGFGADGTIWGGEFLLVSPKDYLRVGHLKNIPMPGGEQAINKPWRMTFSYLYSLYGKKIDTVYPVIGKKKDSQLLKQILDKGINSPLTSSCGRLFDAIASLIGLRDEVDFEGQAAMELEALCKPKYEGNYRYQIKKENNNWVIDNDRMFQQIILDLEKKVSLNKIATQFHNTVTHFILSLCDKIRKEYNINYVALSGGVFQNSFLLNRTMKRLKDANFIVLIHKRLPPNDACISLGQALVADAQIEEDN